jgi:hypothetical protein
MLTNVKRLIRPPIAFLALWATTSMFAASAVSVQDMANGTPNNAPTDRVIAEGRQPTVTWTDTVTRSPWAGGTE